MSKEKQYGLILSKNKAKTAPKKAAAVFNDSSDEDEETIAVVSGSTDWMKRKLSSGKTLNSKSGATGIGTKIKAQTKIEMQRAIEEDPTVYQYDEVYDQMEATKAEQISQKKDKEKKPKYILNMLKQAEVRKKEDERLIERKVQKEREAEGDEFADKEKFVTSAYRKKMEELQKLDEEDRKKEAIENMLDVRKQKDMSGFYRHLYRQTMGEEKGQQEVKEEVKEEEEEEALIQKKTKPSQRSYRKRDSEGDKNESEEEAQSSSSGSSSEEEDIKDDSEERKIEKEKARREELKRQKDKRERRKRRIEEGRETSSEEEDEVEDTKENEEESISGKIADNVKGDPSDKENAAPSRKKVKKDIWKKVTVGEVFEAALQRYLERKAERGSRFPW